MNFDLTSLAPNFSAFSMSRAAEAESPWLDEVRTRLGIRGTAALPLTAFGRVVGVIAMDRMLGVAVHLAPYLTGGLIAPLPPHDWRGGG